MINRDTYIEKIENGFKYNPIVILLGARQVGKTTLMKLYVENKPHIELNGENPDSADLFQGFATIERYLQLNINKDLNGLLIIDEFQFIDNISVLLKLLVDKYSNLKILCSGSSSLDIRLNVKESLAGRVRLIPVYPLSFEEYVKFYDENLYQKFIMANINDNIPVLFPEIPQLLKEYLLYGGLPKVALAHTGNDKKALLKDIFQTYLLKDVKQYVKQKDSTGFNKIIKIISAQSTNLLNIHALATTTGLSYKACENYIYLLEQMFIISLLPPYTTNKRSEISKMKKVYFLDIGLRNVIYNSFNDIDIRTDNGLLFENFVFLELIKHTDTHIYFYRTKDASEIDFIIEEQGKLIPIEVKYKSFKKEKKIRMLSLFSKNNNVKVSYIVNLNFIGKIENQHYIQPYKINQIDI